MKSAMSLLIISVFLSFNSLIIADIIYIDDGLSHAIDDPNYQNDSVFLDYNILNTPGTHVDIVENGLVNSLYTYGNSTVSMFAGYVTSGFGATGKSIVTFSDGRVGSLLWSDENSTITMSGGLVEDNLRAYANSTFTQSGGLITGNLEARDNCTVTISDGTIGLYLWGYGNSSVSISGGSIEDFLYAYDNSTIVLSGGSVGNFLAIAFDGTIYLDGINIQVDIHTLSYGDKLSDFSQLIENGNNDYYTGTVTGILADGSPLNNTFYISNTGDFEGAGDIIIGLPCYYLLAGDVNDDCRFNLKDIAIMASNWLIDCNENSTNPACVPKIE